MKYEFKDNDVLVILKDGHTMFKEDIVKELNQNKQLQKDFQDTDKLLTQEKMRSVHYQCKSEELRNDIKKLIGIVIKIIKQSSDCVLINSLAYEEMIKEIKKIKK